MIRKQFFQPHRLRLQVGDLLDVHHPRTPAELHHVLQLMHQRASSLLGMDVVLAPGKVDVVAHRYRLRAGVSGDRVLWVNPHPGSYQAAGKACVPAQQARDAISFRASAPRRCGLSILAGPEVAIPPTPPAAAYVYQMRHLLNKRLGGWKPGSL